MLFTFLHKGELIYLFFAFKFFWKSFKGVVGCNSFDMVEVTGLICQDHAPFI